MASEKQRLQYAQRRAEYLAKETAKLEEQVNLSQKLTSFAKTAQERASKSNNLNQKGLDIQKKYLESIKETTNSKDALTAIDTAIADLLKEQAVTGTEINSELLAQLERMRGVQTLIVERNKAEEQIQATTKKTKDNLYGSLGTLGEMLKTGTVLGASLALLESVTKGIQEGFKNTLGFAAELTYEIGLSADEAGRVTSATIGAQIQNMRFSQEELNTAAKEYVDIYGTAGGLTADLIGNIAELQKLTGDSASAVQLESIFSNASGDAGVMTDTIKELAKKEGIAASAVMKDMAGNMENLVGASEEALEAFAKQNIELRKQGLNMEKLESIADNMLDIEGSMKAQAKARAMLAGKLGQDAFKGVDGIRAQALAYKNGEMNLKEFGHSIEKMLISQEDFNELGPLGMQQYAAMVGMTKKELQEVYTQQNAVANQITPDWVDSTIGYLGETWSGMPGFLKEATTGILGFIAQYSVLSAMQGGGFTGGIKNMFGMGGGGGDVSQDVANTNQGGGDVGGAAEGSGGGLKSLAEGLREMGDGKVLAGVGVVALAGPAFVMALPAIPFLLFMGKIKLKALEENFTGLSSGLQSMSQAAVGALVMMLVGPALALGLLALPFLLFMSIPGLGPIISTNFTALAAGLAAFGNPATALFVLIGIGLMAALGVAMIPFAFALSLLTPLLEAFGTIVVNVMSAIPPIIGAIADGFVTMFTAISPENVLGMMMLGPALLSASVGMIAFSAALAVGGIASFFGGGVIDQIKELSTIGPGVAAAGEGLAEVATHVAILTSSLTGLGSLVSPLYALGGGLMSISAGLTTMAFSGMMAIPIIGALMGLAAVAPALEGLGNFFGIGGDDSGDSDSELLDEIKGLRSDLQAQPIVLNIDGKAVHRITRVQSRQAVSTRGMA
jgi:hypothetical protein